MADEFAQHSNIRWNGNVGVVEYGGGDRSMIVRFYSKPTQNTQKSLENGRPFFEDVVFVTIQPPGERLNIIDRPATASDKQRWPAQWSQFKENRQQIPEGTPVDLLYPDQPSIAAMLRANAVHTLEQLSTLSANAIESIGMGSQRYVNDAQKYLAQATKGVGAAQFRRELEERDGQIRTLTHQLNLIKKEVERLRGESSPSIPNMDQTTLQNLLTQLVAGNRPQFPAGVKEPASVFDAQTAQINATHTTADVAKSAKRARQRLK